MLLPLKKLVRKFLYPERKLPAWFFEDFEKLTNQQDTTQARFTLSQADFYPCVADRTSTTPLDRHYIYHPAWAARVIARTSPALHIDISSTLHFSTMLSAFVTTEFYDYRPAEVVLDNFHSAKADLTQLFFANDSIASLSCMHTVEHVGLGRYGDPVDYEGDLKAMCELARVLAPGGCLLFATPVGRESKIFFNAHRIYTATAIVDHFITQGLKLVEFSYIPENSGSMVTADPSHFVTSDNYGCGCFWFTK
jgi:SAM-dependent methyltransferase